MLCLCLYVPIVGEAQTEFQYFESKGLPAELKSIFKLSVFIPSQEFSTYRQWKQVCTLSRRAEGQAGTGLKGRNKWYLGSASRKECLKCRCYPSPLWL